MDQLKNGQSRYPVGLTDEAIARSFAINRAYFRGIELDTKFLQGISRWALEREQQVFLRRLYVAKPVGRKLLANKHVRQAACRATVDALLADFSRDPSRKRYFLTFCWDAGVSWERRPHIDLVSLKNMINHRLRRLGLHGFGVVEVEILNNLTGEPGRRLHAHVHCYCWSAGGDFRPKVAARRLSKLATLHNDLGAPSVVIKTVELTEISIARLAAYVTKPPSRGKNRVPRRKFPGRYAMRDVALVPSTATRLIEILSHIEFRDILFGVGEGCALTKEIRRNFAVEMTLLRGRKWEMPDAETVAQHWADIRSRNGSRRFQKPVVITRASQRLTHQAG